MSTTVYHYTSLAALGLMPVALVASPSALNVPIDLALGVILPLHGHIGMNYVITDYVPKLFGKVRTPPPPAAVFCRARFGASPAHAPLNPTGRPRAGAHDHGRHHGRDGAWAAQAEHRRAWVDRVGQGDVAKTRRGQEGVSWVQAQEEEGGAEAEDIGSSSSPAFLCQPRMTAPSPSGSPDRARATSHPRAERVAETETESREQQRVASRAPPSSSVTPTNYFPNSAGLVHCLAPVARQ